MVETFACLLRLRFVGSHKQFDVFSCWDKSIKEAAVSSQAQTDSVISGALSNTTNSIILCTDGLRFDKSV